MLTKKISGTPAAVIKTKFIENQGLELNPVEAFLMKNGLTKKYAKMARSLFGAYLLQKAAKSTTWKEVWSAGQGVGLIEEILPCSEIVQMLIRDYRAAKMPV